MDLWSFIGLVAVAFILLIRFLQFRFRATAGGAARNAPGIRPARVRETDFRARAAAEAVESEWLRPEPAASRAAEQEAQTRKQWNTWRQPERVEERATVVLRKQIPPRDEPPRSWIGGLPMMPEDIAWPRWVNKDKGGDEEEPCHFICQIALADCHPDLWGGLGPREGWLLLFANSNDCEGHYQFVYTRELGAERVPPDDIGPIHDGTYTGQTSWVARETVYPRFPVDLVSMPNRTYERDGVIHASPANLDQLLYEGQAIGDNRPFRELKQPFTWGCVALAARAAIAAMDDTRAQANSERYRSQMREKLLAPGGFEGIIPDKQADVERVLAADGMADIAAADPATLDETGHKRLAYLEQQREALAATEALLERYPDPETLLAFIEKEGEETWRAETRSMLVVLAEFAEEKGRDHPLDEAEWLTVCEHLSGHDKTIWALGSAHSSPRGLPVTVVRRELSILEQLGHYMAQACADEAKRCYLDPGLRGLIPADAVPGLEAHLRSLDSNRPCRMGGYSDGVQHDVAPHPQGKLLLLQMACDYALEMIWGDCGAIYAFIAPEDLAAGKFDKADVHLECH